MSSMKGRLARVLGGRFLRRARVLAAEDVGQGFRWLLVQSDAPRPRAGTKIQVLLPSEDMRTYSPVASRDGIVLLGWKHAGGPGASFFAQVKAGDEVRFVGPQRSLELRAGPVIVVGDETSVSLAAAFAAERPGRVHAVLQAQSVEGAERAAESLDLRPYAVIPRGQTKSLVGATLAAREACRGATIVLTGGSELVVGVRAALRECGINDIKTKPYWVPGRAGLD